MTPDPTNPIRRAVSSIRGGLALASLAWQTHRARRYRRWRRHTAYSSRPLPPRSEFAREAIGFGRWAAWVRTLR